MNIKGTNRRPTRKNQKERTKRTSKYRFKIRILIKIQNPNFKIQILITNVIYKCYIISKDYKRQFKTVKTRGYKVWQNGITKCVRYYKVWQGGLQSASGITKCGRITKWVSTKCLDKYWNSWKISENFQKSIYGGVSIINVADLQV